MSQIPDFSGSTSNEIEKKTRLSLTIYVFIYLQMLERQKEVWNRGKK